MATGSIGRARFPLDAAMKIKGDTDDTLIGNVGDSLKVSSSEVPSSPGSPAFTSKYRSEFDDTGLTMTTAFQTAFTYSGSGKFVGFVLGFTNGNVSVKLTIDSDVIFDLESQNILDIEVGTGNNIGATFGGPVFENQSNKFSFESPFPIIYSTLVKLEVKRITGSPNLTRQIVNLTKET